MNKKRLLLFLFILICIILIPVLYFLLRQTKPEAAFLTASTQEEVNQFYYRAVPGLQMAEETDLIRDIDKQVECPGKDAVLFIDRIWYNMRQVTIFYHVEGVSEAVYLGGEFYLPSNEPVEKQPYHGSKSIGINTEKGILYQDSFYSCLKLPPLRNHSNQVLSEIETLVYTPYINIPKHDDNNKMESVQLKSLDIPLNYQQHEEVVVKLPVDSQMDMEDGRFLHFYQTNLSPSVLQIYFQYLNSSRDQVYRVKGSYTTDKGETHTFDAFPTAITDFPFHYALEIPPFHILPDTMQLQIDSISCIGNDSVSFHIKTDQFSNRNRSNEVEIGRNQIKGTEVLIRNVTLNEQYAEILIAFITNEGSSESTPYTAGLSPLPPKWAKEGEVLKDAANYLTIQDEDFQLYNLDEWSYGADILPEEGLRVRLERKFWDEAGSIYIELANLTYDYHINKTASLTLPNQPSGDNKPLY